MIPAHIIRLILFHPSILRIVLSALRFLLSLLNLFRVRSVVDSTPEACATLPLLVDQDRLVAFLQQHASSGFHIAPNIPRTLLNLVVFHIGSVGRCRVWAEPNSACFLSGTFSDESPPQLGGPTCRCREPSEDLESQNQEILAILEVSSQGTMRSFLLFTSEGAWYHNDFRSRATGTGFLSWQALLKKRFTRASWAEVKMDQEVWLDRSGCAWSSRQLARLMSELQQFIATRMESGDLQNL